MKLMEKALVLIMSLIWGSMLYAMELPGPVVETDWLGKHQDDVLILEVRKDIDSFTQKPVFEKDKKSGQMKLKKVAGHIPGSVLINYKQLRENKDIDGRKAQKMILNKDSFEKLMQAAGVNPDTKIVIVSKGENNLDLTMATRFYWQIKYYGHNKLAILNGGMAQWLVDKRDVSTKPSQPKPGNWVSAAERNDIYANSQDVANAVKENMQLVDTRPLSLYLGTWYKKSYVYNNGHIPGAKSYPNELLSSPMPAKFLTTAESKALFQQMGIDPQSQSITYCNSGHLATGSWFVMSEILGNKKTKMYDGSMHLWTLEDRPVVKFKME